MRKTFAIAAAALGLALTLTACKPPTPQDLGAPEPSSMPSINPTCAVPSTVPNGQQPDPQPRIDAQPNPDSGALFYFEVLTVRVYDMMAGCYVESKSEQDVEITMTADTASGDLATIWNKKTQQPALTCPTINASADCIPMTYIDRAPVIDEQHLQQVMDGHGILAAVWVARIRLAPQSWATCDLHDVGSMSQVSEDTVVNNTQGYQLMSVTCQWPLDLKPHMFDPYGH